MIKVRISPDGGWHLDTRNKDINFVEIDIELYLFEALKYFEEAYDKYQSALNRLYAYKKRAERRASKED